ncbi:hypothetical protein [Methylorubrum extorquens]|uniref:Transposase n=1 Tax=Methylorubrum extorquens TaxID=408 RepID=A0AAX3WDG5_METEX|nr:hypothetical protein [Methylorubrum extorquens]WHQ68645.1 hypothetical protein KEC54_20080 [Methylorubrum extorquens]
MTKAELHEYGTTMYGRRYQPRLAAILSHYRGKPISQAQVSQWVGGEDGHRDPPEWIEPLLMRAAIQIAGELRARADLLDALLDRDFFRGFAKHGLYPRPFPGATDEDFIDPEQPKPAAKP